MSTESAGELSHPFNRGFAAFAHDISCAKLTCQRDPVRMTTQDDDLSRTQAAGGDHAA